MKESKSNFRLAIFSVFFAFGVVMILLSACVRRVDHGSVTASDLPKVNWRLASSFPSSLDTIFHASQELAERVAQLSNGQFTIRVYQAGELVPGKEVMDAVQQGTVQIGHTSGYYYIGKEPTLAFATSVPFGLTARQQTAWMYEGGGLELMQEVYDAFNIVVLPGGNTGTQMGGWFREPINSLEDINGLKMRIPGIGGKIMTRMGASVELLASGDIYTALELGAIDATEWVGPYDDEKLGFHQVASYYYYPGWWEPGPQLDFQINKQAWDALPQYYREILKVAAKEAHMGMLARYDAENPKALKRLINAGVQLRAFPKDVMLKAKAEASAIMEEEASRNPRYKKVYDAWKDFRDSSFAWHALSEYHYAKIAYGEPEDK